MNVTPKTPTSPSVEEKPVSLGGISPQEVRKIASLARLHIDDAEIPGFTKEFNKILAFFGQLDKYDTTAIEAMSHVQADSNVLRDDRALPSLDREAALNAAPARRGAFFQVPLIIDSQGDA